MMFNSRIYFICYGIIVSFVVICDCQVDSKINFLYNGIANRTQSKECFDIIKKIQRNGSLSLWALKMFDSTGKLQSGLLAGNIMSLGDYDQCITIVDEDDGVRGKYCMVAYKYFEEAPFIFGVCLPDVCNLGGFFPGKEQMFYIRDDLCQTNDNDLNGADMACIIVIVSSIILVMIATMYDLHKIKHRNANRALIAFSIYSNTIKLFTINPSELSCLYGIRVLSMMWIMFGHRVSITTSIPSINAVQLINEIKNSNYSNHIYAANFAVDTFIYISGFLIAYVPIKNGYRLKLWHVPRFIVHRWLRILPTITMLYFILVTISRRVGSGPFYKLGVENARLPCVTHWWSYFLFIQNYVNYEYPCLTQTWYLSADMQMHCLSPLVLIPLGKWFVAGNMWNIHRMFCGLMSMFILFPFVLNLNIINGYATHDRLAVFLVGIYAGLHAITLGNKPLYINKILYYSIWLVVSITMVMVAYPARHMIQEPTSTFSIMLASFGRPVWGGCLTWIIYNCVSNRCALINNFLSLPIFEVLSRLSFSMYVLHNFVIGYHSISLRNSHFLSQNLLVQSWISDFFITMIFAFIWSMLYEVPFIHLEKLIFGVPRRKENPYHYLTKPSFEKL